jgi:hypothetical protein
VLLGSGGVHAVQEYWEFRTKSGHFGSLESTVQLLRDTVSSVLLLQVSRVHKSLEGGTSAAAPSLFGNPYGPLTQALNLRVEGGKTQ